MHDVVDQLFVFRRELGDFLRGQLEVLAEIQDLEGRGREVAGRTRVRVGPRVGPRPETDASDFDDENGRVGQHDGE